MKQVNEQEIPFTQLVERKGGNRNTRTTFDKGKLAGLAESITSNGLIQPVVLRQLADNKYMLVAGERRTRAMRDVLQWHGYPPGYALIQSIRCPGLRPRKSFFLILGLTTHFFPFRWA